MLAHYKIQEKGENIRWTNTQQKRQYAEIIFIKIICMQDISVEVRCGEVRLLYD
jgi:hypothetical protein